LSRAGAIDENAPHHLRRDGEELRAVLPLRAPLIDETQIRLVHERGWLQRVALPLSTKVRGSTVPQLFVDECHDALARVQISIPPGREELRDVVRGGTHWLSAEPDLVGLDGRQSSDPDRGYRDRAAVGNPQCNANGGIDASVVVTADCAMALPA